jgi:hypothetical protein
LGLNLLDEQIATALLTGIVAETDRFSNDKTSSITMSMSAALMKAGANQQLVASKLDEQLLDKDADLTDLSRGRDGSSSSSNGTTTSKNSSKREDDGTIEIDHSDNSDKDSTANSADDSKSVLTDREQKTDLSLPDAVPVNQEPPSEPTPPPSPGSLLSSPPPETSSNMSPGAKLMTEPPLLGGTLTANTTQPDIDPVTDPLSLGGSDTNFTTLEHEEPVNVKAPDLQPLKAQENTPNPTLASNPVSPPPIMTPPPPSWSPPPSPTPAPAATPPSSPPQIPDPISSPPAATPTQKPLDDSVTVEDKETLSEIEEAVSSSHVQSPTVDAARAEVNRAYSESPQVDNEVLPPIDSLNATPLGGDLHPSNNSSQPSGTDSSAPPPVPPPIPFQFGSPPSA